MKKWKTKTKQIRGVLYNKVLLVMIVLCLIPFAGTGQEYRNGIRQGVVRVKVLPELVGTNAQLKSSTKNGIVKTGIVSFDNLNTEVKANSMRRIIPFSEKFDKRHRKYGLHLWYEISFDPSLNEKEVAEYYKSLPEIIHAEPNYEKVLIGSTNYTLIDDVAEAAALKSSAAAPFNDQYLSKQWHYINDGQGGGMPGADINIRNIWPDFAGASNIVVAVQDQGVDYNHEDLKNNMWINAAELNGAEGVDDDGNGYVDDIHGYNFGDGSSNIYIGYHGTHVAGTISAENNNNIGVCGIAGGTGNNDGVKIMSLDIFGAQASNRDIPASFVYAADNGAVISQNSWGYTEPDFYEQLVHDAIDYFIAEAGNYAGSPMKGGVVIFAAGNEDLEGNFYPGSYENVINIAALDNRNQRAPYSNYGSSVDLSAPGGDSSQSPDGGVLSTMPDNDYGWLDGTSMACPHVSGIAALIVSKFQGPDFKNTDLKMRLLTSFQDIYKIEANEPYIGKLGLGIIDTEVSMAVNSGKGPDALTDLSLLGIGQDFATLQWTVPADDDDAGVPTNYYIYYSESPITESNLSKSVRVVVSNDNKKQGDILKFEVQGLKPVTTYFFRVLSVDRWENRSVLSNEISDTTNDGPVVKVTPDEISFAIDVTANTVSEQGFTIENSGKGLLKWTSNPYHSSNIDIYSLKSAIQYPDYVPHWTEAPSVETFTVDNVEPRSSVETFAQEEQDKWKHYYNLNAGVLNIGETDLTKPNSSATRFFVHEEEGFNLTNVVVGLNFFMEDGSFMNGIIEVYTGADINTAELSYIQEFVSNDEPKFDYRNIQLNDQLFFNTGEYFWVVVHIPPGPLYPLALTLEREIEYSDNCFMSNDMGRSWQHLGDMVGDDRAVWDIGVVSKLKPLDQYIKLLPDSGVVEAASTRDVKVEIDGSELINGNYNSSIWIGTNEALDTLHRVGLSFTVSGHEPQLKSVDILDFQSVQLGTSKTLDVVIQNEGYGAFADILTPDITNDQFSLDNTVKNIAAKGVLKLTIRFKPTVTGNVNGKVTLTDKRGNTHTFYLFGAGIEPPQIALDPLIANYSNLTLGDTVNGSFNIVNTGAYPLKYFMPRFADGSNLDMNQDAVVACRAGYTYTVTEGNLTNPGFVWEDISVTGTPLIREFIDDSRKNYIPVPIGFNFPFFGEELDTVYITKYAGFLSFDTYKGLYNTTPQYKNKFYPDSYISAWSQLMDLAEEGKGANIYYQRYPDRLVVQYDSFNQGYLYIENNREVFLEEPITFQMVLWNNGDVDFLYKDLGSFQPQYSIYNQVLLAMENKNVNDGLYISGTVRGYTGENAFEMDQPASGYKYSIKSPGIGALDWVSQPSGTVEAGQSQTIDYRIKTDSLYVGDFNEIVSIMSNDPENAQTTHTAMLSIIDGGSVAWELSANELSFGEVFQGGKKELTVSITNSGKAVGEIVSATSKNGYYTIEGYLPVSLKPKSYSFYKVGVITEQLGTKPDVITFTDSDGNTIEVTISGEVIHAPVISSDVTELSAELAFGEQLTRHITVNNEGLNPMQAAISGEEWLSIFEKGNHAFTPEVDYSIEILKDPGAKEYNWEDIEKKGEKMVYPKPFDGDFWQKEALPFSFSFYGVEYDTIYVGHSGLVSFTGGQDSFLFGDSYAPSADGPNNYVAPFHGFIAYVSEEAGAYFYATDDKVIVQYNKMIDLFGMGDPFSFQVVLQRNGSIKYLYRFDAPLAATTSMQGGVGIENADGTKGKQLSFWQEYIVDGMTIVFTPKETYEIPAQSSMEFDVVFDGQYLFGGDYSGDILIENNTPDQPEYSIPASLTIVGEAQYSVPDSMNLGEVMIVMDGANYRQYDNLFTFTNSGTEDILVKAVRLKSASAYGGMMMADDKKFGTGAAEDGWFNISRRSINTVMRPTHTETFNLRITPKNPGEYNDTILVYTDIAVEPIKIPVAVTYYGAPVLSMEHDEMHVYVNSIEEQDQRKMTLSNLEGQSPLEYVIQMNYQRNMGETHAVSNTFNTGSVAPATMNNEISVLNSVVASQPSAIIPYAEEADDFNRVLQYETNTAPDGFLGFNGSAFHGATAFVAPENGFNLTHVKVHYRWESSLNSQITVKVFAGADNINNAIEVYSEEINFEVEDATEVGDMITLKLAQNQLFYPNEKFFVAITFPEGVMTPIGYANLEEPLGNTFFFGSGKAWKDVIDAPGFEAAAYMLKACEETYEMAGWARIEEVSGVIEPGATLEVPVIFDAKHAEQGVNEATMLITTNDPFNEESEVLLTLTRNQGPQFEVGEETNLTVYEGIESRFSFRINDLEGDEFSYAIESSAAFVTIEVVDDHYELVFNPGYEDEGIYFVTISATDAHGNANTLNLDVNTIHVNRNPELVNEPGEQVLILEQEEPYELNLEEYFADPDGDAITYQVKSDNSSLAEIFNTGTILLIRPMELGSFNLIVNVNDPYLGSLTHNVKCFIDHRVGLDDVQAGNIILFPNPVTDVVNISIQNEVAEFDYLNIVSANGTLIRVEQINQIRNNEVKVNVSELNSGVYFIELICKNKKVVKRFIKR